MGAAASIAEPNFDEEGNPADGDSRSLTPLEAQAAAHWRSVLLHARNQIEARNALDNQDNQDNLDASWVPSSDNNQPQDGSVDVSSCVNPRNGTNAVSTEFNGPPIGINNAAPAGQAARGRPPPRGAFVPPTGAAPRDIQGGLHTLTSAGTGGADLRSSSDQQTDADTTTARSVQLLLSGSQPRGGPGRGPYPKGPRGPIGPRPPPRIPNDVNASEGGRQHPPVIRQPSTQARIPVVMGRPPMGMNPMNAPPGPGGNAINAINGAVAPQPQQQTQLPPQVGARNEALAANLPAVLIELKRRTASSITVAWDGKEETQRIISGLSVKPMYELIYRRAGEGGNQNMAVARQRTETDRATGNATTGAPVYSQESGTDTSGESAGQVNTNVSTNNEGKQQLDDDGNSNDVKDDTQQQNREDGKSGSSLKSTSPSMSTRQLSLQQQLLSPIPAGWLSAAVTSNNTTTIENLLPFTLYEIKCRRKWWGDFSPAVTVRSGPGPPSPPIGLHIKEITSTSVMLAWQVPERDNGLPVVEYKVRIAQLRAPVPAPGVVTGNESEEATSSKGDDTKEDCESSTEKKTVAPAAALTPAPPVPVREVRTGRERFFLASELEPDTLYIFQVAACNRVGLGTYCAPLKAKSLPPGAAVMTPWVECIDAREEESTYGKVFYRHPTSGAVVWELPRGALIDPIASLKHKRFFLTSVFKSHCRDTCASLGIISYTNKFTVERGDLLYRSLECLNLIPSDELCAGPIRIKFEGEEGLDAGGLAKDWFGLLAKALLGKGNYLFQMTEQGEAQVDPLSSYAHSEDDLQWYFRAIGLYLGKALQDNQTIGIKLSPVLILYLAGREPSMEQLERADPLYFRGLSWVMENDVTDADLTFSTTFELNIEGTHSIDSSTKIGNKLKLSGLDDAPSGLSRTVTKELLTDGQNVCVTESNKTEYVALMKTWLSRERFEPALSHLLAGFHEMVEPADLQHFNEYELQSVFAGCTEIDTEEILRNVQLAGGFETALGADYVSWLSDILQEMDHQTLSRFLSFVTGCGSLPVDGLQPPLLLTQAAESTDATLPKAHTCFNQLVVPKYSSKQVFRDRLLYALQNTDDAYHMT